MHPPSVPCAVLHVQCMPASEAASPPASQPASQRWGVRTQKNHPTNNATSNPIKGYACTASVVWQDQIKVVEASPLPKEPQVPTVQSLHRVAAAPTFAASVQAAPSAAPSHHTRPVQPTACIAHTKETINQPKQNKHKQHKDMEASSPPLPGRRVPAVPGPHRAAAAPTACSGPGTNT